MVSPDFCTWCKWFDYSYVWHKTYYSSLVVCFCPIGEYEKVISRYEQVPVEKYWYMYLDEYYKRFSQHTVSTHKVNNTVRSYTHLGVGLRPSSEFLTYTYQCLKKRKIDLYAFIMSTYNTNLE